MRGNLRGVLLTPQDALLHPNAGSGVQGNVETETSFAHARPLHFNALSSHKEGRELSLCGGGRSLTLTLA
jgi:hypothetical protein